MFALSGCYKTGVVCNEVHGLHGMNAPGIHFNPPETNSHRSEIDSNPRGIHSNPPKIDSNPQEFTSTLQKLIATPKKLAQHSFGPARTGANAGPHSDGASFFFFCLLFFKWSGRVKLWYPAPWVGNTNVPHSAERRGELACVSRFLTYVMASSRMGDHGRTHKGQANEICARGVRIFCRCMRPPKS